MSSQYIKNEHFFKLNIDNMVDEDDNRYTVQFRSDFKNTKSKNRHHHRLLKKNRKNQFKIKSISLSVLYDAFQQPYIKVTVYSPHRKHTKVYSEVINETRYSNTYISVIIEYLLDIMYRKDNEIDEIDQSKLYKYVSDIWDNWLTDINKLMSKDTIIRIMISTLGGNKRLLLHCQYDTDGHLIPYKHTNNICVNKEHRIYYTTNNYILIKNRTFLYRRLHKLLKGFTNTINKRYYNDIINRDYTNILRSSKYNYGSYTLRICRLKNKLYVYIKYRNIPIYLKSGFISYFNSGHPNYSITYNTQTGCKDIITI